MDRKPNGEWRCRPAESAHAPSLEEVTPLCGSGLDGFATSSNPVDRSENVASLVATLRLTGSSGAEYTRRARAAEILASECSASDLCPYVCHLAAALRSWLERDLSRAEEVFADRYTEPWRRTGEALTRLFRTLARDDPEAIVRVAPLLLSYLARADGGTDHVCVALEAVAAAEPTAIPIDDLLDCFELDDPFVVAAGARLLDKLLGEVAIPLDDLDLGNLEPALQSADSAVSGAAATFLADLVDVGFEQRVISEVDVTAFERPLRHADDYSCVSATSALCGLVAAGFGIRIVAELDVSALDVPLHQDDADVAGNAAVTIGYLADTPAPYGSAVAEQVDYDRLAELLAHDDPFVANNAASALAFLAEHDRTDRIPRAISGRDLATLIRHGDPDIVANATALLNEIVDGGHVDALDATFDFGSLAAALTHPNPLPRGNAASTPGYLAERGAGDVAVANLDLGLLDRCLSVEAERVCGGAVGSLADLVEAGHGAVVVRAVDVSSLVTLLSRPEPYVCGNAVLAVGQLAASGFVDILRNHLTADALEQCLAHEDPDVVEHATLAVAALAARGCESFVLDVSSPLQSILSASGTAGTRGAIAAVSYCCQTMPRAVRAHDDGELVAALFDAAHGADLRCRLEVDPAERVLWTLVASACHSLSQSDPTFVGEHAQRIRRLFDGGPCTGDADRGEATTLLVSALAIAPSRTLQNRRRRG